MSALDYRNRAQLHRPSSPFLLGREMRRLAESGLTPRDIAVAMQVEISVVIEALRKPQEPAG